MKCLNCNFNNEQGARSCRVCGTRLISSDNHSGEELELANNNETPKEVEISKDGLPSVRRFEIGGVSFNMILVEGGTFWMGAQNKDASYRNYDVDAINIGYDFYRYPGLEACREDPVHQVTLSSFYISETLVTQGLWEAVMGYAMGSKWEKGRGIDYPLYDIGPFDMVDIFLNKLDQLSKATFLLPSEAEWEYAARGGRFSKGYKYSGGNNIDEVAWWNGNSGACIHPVARKSPNELGIYDMSGNLQELCSDYISEYLSIPQTNPNAIGRLDRKTYGRNMVLRGGSWIGDKSWCRVTRRSYVWAGSGYFSSDMGLRLVFPTELQ